MSEETYEGLDKKDVAHWLHQAEDFRDELAPEGVLVDSRSHSTAEHVYVYLTLDGEDPLLVWYKTNWISHIYEFNENGKVQGVQPGCEFIRPALEQFFADVRDRLKAERDARIDREDEAKRCKADDKAAQIDRFRHAYSA